MNMNKIKRMWVNQPSTLQPYNHLHGTNVLATEEVWHETTRIYFLEGSVISQQIATIALDPGWLGEENE